MTTIDRVDYDTELQRHNEVLRRAWGIRPRDHVIDVGCGAGQTTRDAARLAEAGSALGVDISASMIERAQELAEAEGFRNVAFVHADASVHQFPPEKFDVSDQPVSGQCSSPIRRFAAFANLVHSLRHNGRLVMIVWQDAERNVWEVSIRRALAIDVALAAASPAVLDAFSLANPSTTVDQSSTHRAWPTSFSLTCRSRSTYGAHVAAALDWVCGFSSTKEALRQMAPAVRERAFAALRETLIAHNTGRGIWFNSRASARCRSPPLTASPVCEVRRKSTCHQEQEHRLSKTARALTLSWRMGSAGVYRVHERSA